MIECPSCGRKHRPGTLFCSECGVYLLTGGPVATEPISGRELPAARAPAWSSDSAQERAKQRGAVLRIRVLSTGRQIQLPSEEGVHLGRLDAAHDIFPDIDLTPDEVEATAAEHGLEGKVFIFSYLANLVNVLST